MWITTPSRSFGSNQVDFGGMILPASAIARSSSIEVGIKREGDRHLSRVHPPLQLLQPPDSSHKIDPLARPGIVDAKHRVQEMLLQDRDVQTLHRVADGQHRAGVDSSLYHRPFEVHAVFPFPGRPTGLRFLCTVNIPSDLSPGTPPASSRSGP